MSGVKFKVIERDAKSSARIGQLTTIHGVVNTPAFVPVGTQATVKSLTPDELNQLGVELFFVNTYHAYLRPGVDVIQKVGGLHQFMNWKKPLITDSGGFQVFSLGGKKYVNAAISESAVLDRERFTKKLSKSEAIKENVFPDEYRPVGELVKIDDEGVTFTSHWDGTKHRFTPEISIDIQHELGADFIIAFDECAPYPTTHEYARVAMERTHRWAQRSLEEHRLLCHSDTPAGGEASPTSPVKRMGSSRRDAPSSVSFPRMTRSGFQPGLYGVIQGSVYEDLRKESADYISVLGFDGIAIGGVAVGESKEDMRKVCDWVVPRLPVDKPRHLLGVGEIDDIFDIVTRGIDTFDCVQPTRLARMGKLFTNSPLTPHDEKLHEVDITKKTYAEDTSPIDKACSCYTCQNFTRAYIHHLFRVRELLAYRLATIHNLHFVLELTKQIRLHIASGTFLQFKREFFRM